MSLLKKLRNKKLQKAVLSSVLVLSLGFSLNDRVYAGYQVAGGSATGDKAIAIGSNAVASSDTTIAIGVNVEASDTYHALVIGWGSHASNMETIAAGYKADATGNGSTAIGSRADASGSFSIAMGFSSHANADRSIAIGRYSFALGENSLAFGYNSLATENDTVSFGSDGSAGVADKAFTRRLVNVSAGINDTDAANVSQLISSGSYDNDTKKLTLSSNSGNDVIVDLSALSGDNPDVDEPVDLSKNDKTARVVDGLNTKVVANKVTEDKENNLEITEYQVNVEGNGAAEEGNTGLISGDTLYNELKDKADITYIDAELANKADTDLGNITDDGKGVIGNIAEEALADDLNAKANVNASNVADHTAEWGAAIGTGAVEDGNGELVTGGTVFNAVKGKADIAYVDNELLTKADVDLSNITEGGQTVIQNIAKGSVKLENGTNTTVSSTDNADGSLTYKVNVEGNGVAEEGNTGLVSGDTLYNTVNDITNNFTEITDGINTELNGKANVDASNVANHTAEWGAAIGTGVVENGNGELVTGGTVYNAVKGKADITYVDNKLLTKADVDLGNITGEGETVIQSIAKGSVKLENGTNTTVSSTENEDGSLTYKVNAEGNGVAEEGNTGLISGDTLYNTVNEINNNLTDVSDEINLELQKKANADASNVVDHTAEWGAAIGTGAVEDGNGELVTGGTVFNAVKGKADITYVDSELLTKADVDLSNITEGGQTVIQNIAKGSVKLENGTNTTVSSTDNADGSLTYKVNVEGNGVAEEGNTGLVSGDTLYNTVNEITTNIDADLEGKANADASNVANHTAEWGAAIGTGVVEDGNGELVTGDTVYEAVKDKADKDYVDEQLSGKADADLGNLTDEGKDVIKDIAKDTVKVEDGLNTTVSSTENADGSISYQVNVEGNGVAEAGNTGLINGDTLYNTVEEINKNITNVTEGINAELDGKANADASNVADHTAEWGAAIGTGKVEAGNGELVTGDTVYNAVKDKADADFGNITDEGKDVIGDIAQEALQDDLDGKANIDASNIETDKWADKLGTGTIVDGDKNLVNGDTVYDAIKNMGGGLVMSDGKTITVGKDDGATVIDVSKHNGDGNTENRVITGVATDANDMSSAANVGYVNQSVGQLANDFNRGLSELDSQMKKGVAGAAALAALNPLDYDPENKLNFAAGVGSYKGESATALGMFYRPNENVMFSLGGAFGNGENMWNAGITFNLDKPSASTSKAAMARAIKTMAAENDALEAKTAEQDAKIALLTEQVEALLAAQEK